MITITRIFEFDSAHRILNHESRCRHIHGHRYKAEVTVTADGLDTLGRVIDFSVLKEKVGNWIDEHWDHNVILHKDDPLLMLNVVGQVPAKELHPRTYEIQFVDMPDVFMGKEPYILSGNPTAENMAWELFHIAFSLMVQYHIKVVHIRLYETPNCWADVELFRSTS